jgi:hypothetical protein
MIQEVSFNFTFNTNKNLFVYKMPTKDFTLSWKALVLPCLANTAAGAHATNKDERGTVKGELHHQQQQHGDDCCSCCCGDRH